MVKISGGNEGSFRLQKIKSSQLSVPEWRDISAMSTVILAYWLFAKESITCPTCLISVPFSLILGNIVSPFYCYLYIDITITITISGKKWNKEIEWGHVGLTNWTRSWALVEPAVHNIIHKACNMYPRTKGQGQGKWSNVTVKDVFTVHIKKYLIWLAFLLCVRQCSNLMVIWSHAFSEHCITTW